MYVKASNQVVERFPYTIGDFKKDYPNTSFPKEINDTQLSEWGVERVTLAPMIDVPAGKVAVQNSKPDYEEGKWVLNWTVRDYAQNEINGISEMVRMDRNRLLSESDWTQLPDAPVDSQAWSNYRQSLRDITKNPAFPFVTLPEAP